MAKPKPRRNLHVRSRTNPDRPEPPPTSTTEAPYARLGRLVAKQGWPLAWAIAYMIPGGFRGAAERHGVSVRRLRECAAGERKGTAVRPILAAELAITLEQLEQVLDGPYGRNVRQEYLGQREVSRWAEGEPQDLAAVFTDGLAPLVLATRELAPARDGYRASSHVLRLLLAEERYSPALRRVACAAVEVAIAEILPADSEQMLRVLATVRTVAQAPNAGDLLSALHVRVLPRADGSLEALPRLDAYVWFLVSCCTAPWACPVTAYLAVQQAGFGLRCDRGVPVNLEPERTSPPETEHPRWPEAVAIDELLLAAITAEF